MLCFQLKALPEGGVKNVIVEGKYPLFGGELVQYTWLSDEDLQAVQRLLTVVKHFDNKLDYCPSLPSVISALLQVRTALREMYTSSK